jgi:hypothetical protein
VAMCLFITTGEIMNRTGVTRALVDFTMCRVGRLRGGSGYVKCGGSDRSRKIAAVCAAAGIPCYLGGCIETHPGVGASVPFSRRRPTSVPRPSCARSRPMWTRRKWRATGRLMDLPNRCRCPAGG